MTRKRIRAQERRAHRPAAADPRAHLLHAVLSFVQAAHECAGVRRIAMLGSLTTAKAIPKDADVLVVIDDDMDLAILARLSRRLKGRAQNANLGADIFLADRHGRYIGRICSWRQCWPRQLCRAQRCGQRPHLNDDFHVITLSAELISHPPVDLWPAIVRREQLPPDVEQLLLVPLEQAAK